MSIEQEIVEKYNRLVAKLSDEYFETLNVGTPYQERRLRSDKTPEEFNQKNTEMESNRIAGLEAAGFVELLPPSARDLAAEIGELKARIAELEKK